MRENTSGRRRGTARAAPRKGRGDASAARRGTAAPECPAGTWRDATFGQTLLPPGQNHPGLGASMKSGTAQLELRRETRRLRDELTVHRQFTEKAQAAAEAERAGRKHLVLE